MKTLFLYITLLSTSCFAQKAVQQKTDPLSVDEYVASVNNLTLEAALDLQKRVTQTATSIGKNVTIAILDASGNIILLTRGDGVGPHNTEAARRKAYTALSTKTSTLVLLRNATLVAETKNLNTLPELLLLSGGVTIWYKGKVIGSIGVAGGGSAENDDLIAKSASITEIGITTTNQ